MNLEEGNNTVALICIAVIVMYTVYMVPTAPWVSNVVSAALGSYATYLKTGGGK